MRQTEKNNITVQYPDAVGFAFLPCIIKASGSNLSWIEVIIRYNNIERSYNVETLNGSCITDFKTYVQALFDGRIHAAYDWTIGYDTSVLNILVGIEVNAYDDRDGQLASIDFTTNMVWGAPKYGETWNGYKRLTWFTHYPFTFGIYLSKLNANLLIGYEGAPNELLKIPFNGIVDFYAGILPSGAKYWNIYDYDGEIQQGTFDNTFDLTFRLTTGGKQSLLLRIDRDDAESGIYLRWIDRHGFIRYWLFAAGEETREIASDLSFIRNNLADFLNQHFGGKAPLQLDQLDAELDAVIAHCQKAGLKTQRAIASYALACSLFGNDRVAGDPSIVGILADRSSSQIDRAMLIEMWTAAAYSDFRRAQGG